MNNTNQPASSCGILDNIARSMKHIRVYFVVVGFISVKIAQVAHFMAASLV